MREEGRRSERGCERGGMGLGGGERGVRGGGRG